MMKKNGFTLAEVLITLAIIGVVATMTLPALMTNTGEQQAKTALKKGINTLTETAQMSSAIDGFDYSGITSSDTTSTDNQSLYAMFATRTNMDLVKSGKGKIPSYQNSTADSGSSNYSVILRDGSAILYNPAITMGNATANSLEEDGYVHGIPIIYDTNGTKGPNVVSNCKGQSLGASQDEITSDASSACSGNKRVIKDQFGVRLRGAFVVPNGAAARWAFEN